MCCVQESNNIKGKVDFRGTIIGADVMFEEVKIRGSTVFVKTKAESASFNGVTFEGESWFLFKDIFYLNFKNTKFSSLKAQENACREAKIVNERRGDTGFRKEAYNLIWFFSFKVLRKFDFSCCLL